MYIQIQLNKSEQMYSIFLSEKWDQEFFIISLIFSIFYKFPTVKIWYFKSGKQSLSEDKPELVTAVEESV